MIRAQQFAAEASVTAEGGPQSRAASPLRPPRNRLAPVVASAADVPTPKTADLQTQLSQFGAGALAGLVNTLALSPLDVVKTRLQAQGTASFPARRYHGVIHALRAMFHEEGLRSYYRGLSASLWAFVPNWAIYWYSYETCKRAFTPGGRRPTPLVHVASAVSAGTITAVTTAPFWTLKSRLQIDMAVATARRRYRSVPHGFRKIVREEGLSGLYKGLVPTLLGLGHVAVQFPLYEHLKSSLSRRSSSSPDERDGVNAGHVLLASSLSKIVASAVFYPHEVIRTRIQVDTTAVRKSFEVFRVASVFRDIVRTSGARGLYQGFGANLIRTVPACMLTFTSYEFAKRFAENQSLRRRQTNLISKDLERRSLDDR